MRSKTNEQLADCLLATQVDRSTLMAAAERLRRAELDQLLASIETVQAINSNVLIDKHTAELVEPLILAPAIRRQSSSRMSSLAGRILQGADYTHDDVLSLAASVLSQDETQGQS